MLDDDLTTQCTYTPPSPRRQFNSMSGTPWLNIITTYWDSTSGACPDGVSVGAVMYDTARSQGTTLTNAGVQAVAANAINTGTQPLDVNGIYIVLADSATTNSGLCTSFCGWHTNGVV